jgi:DNA-binding IclR family transcriptional regulator
VGILRRLGTSGEPMSLNQVAQALDLVPSTCLHILRVLVDEGLVDFDSASKRYAIGVGILPIARNAIQRNGFATLVQPTLDVLSKRFDATAMATQLIETQQMVVVAQAHAPLPFRLSAELGSRLPALISATGRCVAAFGELDDKALRRGFEPSAWDNPPDFKTWKTQIDQTRRAGYGVDRGEYISGVTIVAVPFFRADGSVAQSMVAVGLSEKMETTGIATIAQEMLKMRDDLVGFLISD